MTHPKSFAARWSVLALVGGAGGCVPIGEDFGLLVPSDVDVAWDVRFDTVDDGRVALVPVDVLVYAARTGAPVADAQVVVSVFGGAVGLVDPEGVSWLDDPSGASEVPDPACAAAPEACADLAPVWDAWRDRYAQLRDEPAVSVGLRTDADGMARTYVWVDGFDAPGEAGPVSNAVAVVVSTSDVEDSFFLLAR